MLKDDVFFQKLIQTLKNHNQLDTLRYETDLYTLMRFANEPHGYYKLHNYDFEKYKHTKNTIRHGKNIK